MSPTPYSDLNELLDAFVNELKDIAGTNLLEIYLQGSFAVGDFDVHSDVDFIAVLEEDLSEDEVRRLNEMHHRLYAMPTEWAKHLEGSYFPIQILAKEPGEPVWYLDHGSVTLERSAHCNTNVVRWTVEHFGIPLLHPNQSQRGWGPLAGKIPNVTSEALRAEMTSTLLDWGKEILADPGAYQNRFYQGFIVLSYCRMLRDIEPGTVGSKKTGADWARANLPSEWHDLIDRAWTCRPEPAVTSRTPADPADFARTLEFVEFAMARVNGT